MVTKTDPNGTQPSGSGNAPSTGDSGGSGSDVVSREAHEAAIAEERKRRAGMERTHQKELAQVRRTLEEVKAEVGNLKQGGSEINDLPADLQERLDPNDPRDRALIDMYRATGAWTTHMKRQEEARAQEERLNQLIGEAVEEAEEAGVPRTALDTSSPDAVRRSVEKYQADQRIRTLEEQIADMRKGSDKLRETAATARTQERQRLGATQVLTSTGEMPPLPTEQSEEIDRLEHEKAEAKRHRDGALVLALDRQIRQLRAQ